MHGYMFSWYSWGKHCRGQGPRVIFDAAAHQDNARFPARSGWAHNWQILDVHDLVNSRSNQQICLQNAFYLVAEYLQNAR